MYILPVSRSTRRPAVVNLIFALATVFTASFQSSASADYRLNPGDVLELSAVGLKELQQKSTIGPDGYVLFPLLGPIKVAGLSLPELRAKVQEVLPTKIFRRRTEDGREYPVVLNAEEIIVTIA